MQFKTFAEVIAHFDVSLDAGLSDESVKKRQQQHGKNQFASYGISWLHILISQVANPLSYLLFAAGIFSFITGELLNAILVFLFIALNTLLGFYQEYHAENTVGMLKKLMLPKTTVRRNGKEYDVLTTELVVGDIVILEPGDIVPADLVLVHASGLTVDESVLTGESFPVAKYGLMPLDHHDAEPVEVLPDNFSTKLSCGTSITTGSAVGLVAAIGAKTAIGKIADSVAKAARVSIFSENVRRFTLIMMGLIAVTLGIIFSLFIFFKSGQMQLHELFLFAVALTISILPEGLPLVITFCLSKSAAFLSKHSVIVKRLSAIEDLGSIKVLCTDKTGTLTYNKLSVVGFFGNEVDVITAAIKAGKGARVGRVDAARSFDTALEQYAVEHVYTVPSVVVTQYLPFNHIDAASHTLLQDGAGYALLLCGTPEALIARSDIEPALRDQIMTWFHDQGSKGYRVLAVARKDFALGAKPAQLNTVTGCTIVGAIAFADQVKPTAKAAIAHAHSLGVAVKIITGDTPEVAATLAYEVDLITSAHQIITGAQLAEMNQHEQLEAYQKYTVFARMNPFQKVDMIRRLQTVTTVGYLGEGINDAPALKEAHVALVVENGTDIAKDAADIILTKKSLSVIIDGIEQGRFVVANTVKYIQLMLICNVSNFYSIAIASLFIDFLPMLPVQVLLVNVFSDFPLVAIATDYVDQAELKQPQAYYFSRMMMRAFFLGAVSSVFDFIFFIYFYPLGAAHLQTAWFMYSVCAELLLFYIIRTPHFVFFAKRPPFMLTALSLSAGIISIVLPMTRLGQKIFSFVDISFSGYALFFGILAIYCITMECAKHLYNACERRYFPLS
jgi:P-type Mg2+ transporter